MIQLALVPQFDGETYDESKDFRRLNSQFEKVKAIMSDGKWWSPYELKALIGGSESGITARIRDLKKERFGAYKIDKRRRTTGTWEYRICLTDGYSHERDS